MPSSERWEWCDINLNAKEPSVPWINLMHPEKTLKILRSEWTIIEDSELLVVAVNIKQQRVFLMRRRAADGDV